MKKSFKKYAAIMAVVLSIVLMSTSISVMATEDNSKKQEIVKVKKHTVKIDNEEVTIEEELNNGVRAFNVQGKKVDEAKLHEELNKLAIDADAEQLIFTEHTDSDYDDGYSTSNSNAYLESWATGVFEHLIWGVKGQLTISGTQHGHLYGTNPIYADNMVFRQATTINGTSLTISWPPSATGSSTTKEWSSQPTGSTYCYYVDRAGVRATSYVAIYGADITDHVEIYAPGKLWIPVTYLSID